MCFQSAYSFIYLFLGGICCQANACHQQPYCSSAHTQTLGLFCLAFKYIPTLHPAPPTQPFPPAISPIHAVSPLALPCFSPFSPFWSVRQLKIQFFPPPFLFGRMGWVGWGAQGQIRISETEAEVRSALIITNRRGLAWRNVRKNSGSGSAQNNWMLHSFIRHRRQWRSARGRNFYVKNDLELPGVFKGSLREGI